MHRVVLEEPLLRCARLHSLHRHTHLLVASPRTHRVVVEQLCCALCRAPLVGGGADSVRVPGSGRGRGLCGIPTAPEERDAPGDPRDHGAVHAARVPGGRQRRRAFHAPLPGHQRRRAALRPALSGACGVPVSGSHAGSLRASGRAALRVHPHSVFGGFFEFHRPSTIGLPMKDANHKFLFSNH